MVMKALKPDHVPAHLNVALDEPKECAAFLRQHGFRQSIEGNRKMPDRVTLTRVEGMFKVVLHINRVDPPSLAFSVRTRRHSPEWRASTSYLLADGPRPLGDLAYHAFTMMEAVVVPEL